MFGKSLFLSTLKYILEGHKDLFTGLYIHDKPVWTSTYTVFHLDFSEFETTSMTALKNSFINKFHAIARTKFKTKLSEQRGDNDVCAYFGNLIEITEEVEPNKRLSLLIDEYDTPITKNLHNINKAKEMQTLLGDFFVCLKSNIIKFHLVYITGVTKFTKANLFSSLSNVRNLSRREEFNDVCGFTRQEIEKDMMGHLQVSITKEKGVGIDHEVTPEDMNKLLDEIASFYYGYRFSPDGKAIFSPSATMTYFVTHHHHEFQERTPQVNFVFDVLLRYKHADFPIIGRNVSAADIKKITNLDDLKIKQILLDTGILTINSYDKYSNTYFLDFPNERVKRFTVENLLPKLSKSGILVDDLLSDSEELLRRLSVLNRENSNEFFEQLMKCYDKYTYFEDQPKQRKNSREPVEDYMSKLEYFYEFHLFVFLALGTRKTPVNCIVRQRTLESGRTDMTVLFSNRKAVIFELKLNLKPKIDTAKAIDGTVQATKYVQTHFAKNDVITSIGLVCNYLTKTIENWIEITYNRESKENGILFAGRPRQRRINTRSSLFLISFLS